MAEDEAPTRERPIYIGAHEYWIDVPGVHVVVYRGPLEEEEVAQLVTTVLSRSDGLVAVVSDARELTRFTPEARRAMARFDADDVVQSDAELRVYTCGTSVVTRAFMTLGIMASRLISKRKTHILFPATFEEGLRLARAYAREVAASRGDAPSK